MLIQILIPTYNRSKDLYKNLCLLKNEIEKYNLFNEIEIIIQDNASPDETQKIVHTFIDENRFIKIQYYRNDKNIGLEKNALEVLKNSNAPYILWLGDDDFLPDGYLKYLVFKIQHSNQEVGCCIPGNAELLENGEIKGERRANFEEKKYEKGFDTMLQIGHYAHQMSGILLKRESLMEEYLKNEEFRNPYLFIFFTNYCLLKYSSFFVPKYKVLITTSNQKDWKYDMAGLLPEVYKSYYYFISMIGERKVTDLIMDFTTRHSWRFGIEIKKPIVSFKRLQYLLLHIKPLSSLKTKILILFVKDYIYRIIN
jgi:glycosyltransferase involved in cell wall biosynthesis